MRNQAAPKPGAIAAATLAVVLVCASAAALAQTGAAERTPPAENGGAPAPAIVGVWEIDSGPPLDIKKRKLTIRPDLTGGWEADGKTLELRNIKAEADRFAFEVTLTVMQQALAFKIDGTAKEGRLTGRMISDLGAANLTGRRIGEAVLDVAGDWLVTVSGDDITTDTQLVITRAESGAKAVWTHPMGRSEYEVRLEGAVLSIEGDIDLQDVGRGAIRFKATVAGETFEGKIALILGDETFDLAARGRRVAKGGLSGEVILEGVWDLVITMPDGETAAGEMTVTREGDGPWIARMQTDLGLAQIKDIVVEGNRIRFETTVDLGGVKVGLKFSGTTGGGALKGNATVIIEGAPLDFTVDGKLRGRHPN